MKINKYQQVSDKTLDLHGLTTHETTLALGELLSISQGLLVRIIVGRGKRSKNGPVLPEHVKGYLMSANIPHHQSNIRDGGEGSIEVQL